MQPVPGLVSIIIPAYNAAEFLPETIVSVQQQTYSNWEMVVVDDGSTDATATLVKKETDSRIKLIQQVNSGVSAARNNGLKIAAGDYIIFLDADDLMTPSFIEIRIKALLEDTKLGFIGGYVETFPLKSVIKKAIGVDPEREILFFDVACSTVPSNYMFRKKILCQNKLWFNTNLSSTADRFFLLQVSKHTMGRCIYDESGKLLYRVNANSMSHRITSALILDNERFYKELVKHDLLPGRTRKKFKSLYFFSLAFGFAKVKHFGAFASYIWKSAVNHPIFFSRLLFKRIFRT